MDHSGENKENKYFESYVDPEVHKLMIRDRPRTDGYRNAILQNSEHIRDKIVMDIGAGSGILSLFCWKAGAKKVYAVEASGMASVLRKIVVANHAEGAIEVVQGRAEEIDLPEKVDIIVSEWMGFYLLHESMLGSVILAREKHLKDEGVMLPSHATIWAAPCSLDEEARSDLAFWDDVYGFDMSPMKTFSSSSFGPKPEILHVAEGQLLSSPQSVVELDLRRTSAEQLVSLRKRSFVSITDDGSLEGICLWFDCDFRPPSWEHPPILSTSPAAAETHWKQTVIVLPQLISVEKDEVFGWDLTLEASEENPRSYRIGVEVLDPEEEEHPVPCGCQWAKCLLIQALMQQSGEDISTDDGSMT